MAADGRITYKEMGDCLLGNKNVYCEDNCRKVFYFLYKLCDMLDNEIDYSGADELSRLNEAKRELEKEKVKFRDERAAYNAQNRNAARLEQKTRISGECPERCRRGKIPAKRTSA